MVNLKEIEETIQALISNYWKKDSSNDVMISKDLMKDH